MRLRVKPEISVAVFERVYERVYERVNERVNERVYEPQSPRLKWITIRRLL